MKAIRNPLVSIVIPVYNGSNYLKESIESALSQTYKNIEIIVVNDGSNDGGKTLSIMQRYNNIVLVNKENGGVSSALNSAIAVAKGDYISWLSHDDLYKENKIKHQIDFILANKQKKIIPYCKTCFIDQNSKILHRFSIQARRNKTIDLTNSPFGASFNGCSLLIPKEALNTPFNEKYRYIQDTIKWYELLKNGYVFMCSGHADSLLRVHKETVTNKHPELYEKEFSKFYIKAREDVLQAQNLKGLKQSTKSLALMSKKYPFYKNLINENLIIIKNYSSSNNIFLKTQIKLRYLISSLIFH